MPPTDELFDDQEPKDDSKAPSDSTAKIADLERQLTELSKAKDEGAATTKELATAIQSLNQQLATALADDEPPKDQAPPDPKSQDAARQAKFNKFYEDPDAYIGKGAQEAARTTLGPYLRMQAEQRRDELLEAEESKVDQLHGHGAWAKYFSDEVSKTMASLPLEMQASRTHIQAAVNAVYGSLNFNESSRTELEKARTEAAKSKTPPAMLDGGRPAPKPGSLNDDEQALIASLARSGIELSPKDYLAAKERGGNESRWQRPSKSARS